jgi:RNA polymerase sigma-54 factor
MRFDASLQQRLEQRMILAPRMIQAMEILQLPLMALQERIDEELIANPVLEIRADGEEAPPEAGETNEGDDQATATLAEPERELIVREDEKAEDFERLSNLVDRWEGFFEEDSDSFRRSRAPAGDVDPKAEAMQNAPDVGVTLQEHMLGLWHLEGLDSRATTLGELVIRNLDDSGYLRVPLEELATEAEPPVTVEEMAEVLEEVQLIGPAGVGARNLEECLMLQLQGGSAGNADGRLPEDSIEVRIIRNHLHDIEANRYPQMAKALGATMEEIKEAVDRIRRLNPRPGSVISPRSTPTIIPDVRIEWDEETRQYRITILKGGTPELYISRAYRRLVKQRDLDDKTRQFVANNIRSARWLMEAIEQRRDTLRRVSESIVKFQRPFFDDGPEHLQPLKMQQVADDVHLHVGTISRAVADKYADTPHGTWALRDFFIGGTQTTDGGGDVSWDQVRARLKALVEAEDKAAPLSDEDLMERLLAEGIGKLARRTVAKYREEMGIPSSRRRKQF